MTMMGFTEHVLFCFLLHVPLFLIEPNPLQSCSDLKYCLSATVSPIRSSGPCILVSLSSQCLLSALVVVFKMVVLSFSLLVTKEIAPPGFRVVQLLDLHLLHSERGTMSS